MEAITVPLFPIAQPKLLDLLRTNGIQTNSYAEQFLAHSKLDTEIPPGKVTVVFCSLAELGFPTGALWPEIAPKARSLGLAPCRPAMGVFIRLSHTAQNQSRNCILRGNHCAPDGSIVVFSEPLEEDNAFPKGLYLRNIGGTLWLRGYVCDNTHIWSPGDVFAFEKMT